MKHASSLSESFWIPVVATGAAFFMIVLDTTIVNLALVRIGSEFRSDLAALQWLVDGYAMIFASLLLGAGAFGDRLGVKGTFMSGLALFTLASIACGLSSNIDALQVSRVVQGVGAALLLPNSMATLSNTFADPARRSRAIAAWASAGALGVAVGPVLGGFFVQTLGWRSIFLINVPVGVAALWMTWKRTPAAPRHVSRSLDPIGQLLAMFTLASATYTLINMGRVRVEGLSPWVTGALCVVLALLFGFVELRQMQPMLPLRLLSIPTLGSVALVGLLHNVSIYGLIFVLSLAFQSLEHLPPFSAGALFLPMTLALAGGTRIGAHLLRRHGAFRPLILGHLFAAAGALCLALASRHVPLALWSVPLTMIGLGAGVTTPAMSLAVLDSVERTQSGLASGILNSARQTGGVIGVAVLGALLGQPATWTGMRIAELAAAVTLIAAGCLAYLASRRVSRAPGILTADAAGGLAVAQSDARRIAGR